MAVTPFKTFIAGEVLTASDLNSSILRLTDNGEDLGWPATKAKDLDGNELIGDSDGDSSITFDTDDRMDVKLGGVDLFRFLGVVASVINGLDFTGSATGVDVSIDAVGTDTDISINFVPKGTGVSKSKGVRLATIDDINVPALESGANFAARTNEHRVNTLASSVGINLASQVLS